MPVSNLPKEIVMSSEEMVDAALAPVSIRVRSSHSPASRTAMSGLAYEEARRALAGRLSSNHAAPSLQGAISGRLTHCLSEPGVIPMALKRLRESVRFRLPKPSNKRFYRTASRFLAAGPTNAEPVVVPEKSLFSARRRPDDTVHRDEQDFPLGESPIRSPNSPRQRTSIPHNSHGETQALAFDSDLATKA